MSFLVSAVPPVTESSIGISGLLIEYPAIDYVKFGNNVSFHFHVYNSSGFPLTAQKISCGFHLYNRTGSHIYQNENVSMDSNLVDFTQKVGSTQLTNNQIYSYIFYCNDTTQGAFVRAAFEVNNQGEAVQDMQPTIIFLSIMIMVFLGIGLFLFFGRGRNDN